jgi:hypothetical protein
MRIGEDAKNLPVAGMFFVEYLQLNGGFNPFC